MERKRKQPVHWEEVYRKSKKNVWRPKPHTYSIKAFKLIKKGRVLDLGSGDGHDALYFAQKGCDVTAVDISKTAIEKLKNKAKQEHLSVTSVTKDIRKFKPKGKYAAVVSYGTLQFLGSLFTAHISNLQKQTLVGGVHSLYLFGNKGDFYSLAKHRFHFPSKAELNKIYKGWKIISFEQKNARLLVKDDEGRSLYNVMHKILVQKQM